MKNLLTILVIISIIGTITVTLSLTISTIADGDVNHGRVTNIHRNENFFTSNSIALNSILILPRYFFKVTQNPYKIETNTEMEKEGYGGLNLFIGLLAVILLIFASLVYNHGGIFGKIFSLSYTFYWAIVTIFMYGHFFSGIFLFTSNTWGG